MAGISTTWYVRLEQGRDVRVSLHALDRIGKALRLDASEQAYLLELARPDLAWRSHVRSHENPSQALLAIVNGLMPHQAYVLNKYWQVKACNRSARLLLGDLDNEDQWGANLVLRLFLDEPIRERCLDWPSVVRSVAAQLRFSAAAMAGDRIMKQLLTQLGEASSEFRLFWERAELAEASLWSKTLVHPRVGHLHFDFAAFSPPGPDGNFSLAIHTASGENTIALLQQLLNCEPP